MLKECIKMAFEGMLSNKLRTFLTMLGIIIGVGAVIAMVSLGLGMQEKVKENISSMGSNLLIVMSGGRTANGQRIASGSGAHLTYDMPRPLKRMSMASNTWRLAYKAATSLLRETKTGIRRSRA